MVGDDTVINVEVAYVNDDRSFLLPLTLNHSASISDVIAKSGILDQCPEIDLKENKVGVFSQVRELNDLVEDGDRIEIYRPLLADPKDSRRRRAAGQKHKSVAATGKPETPKLET